VMAREDTYQQLKMFDDVVNLITNNYVEQVNADKVMHGAMHGLADSLDPDSAFLTPSEVKLIESGSPIPAGDVGIDLTRQYYLRIIATRDGSPAAKAGLRTGDYVRAIDKTPTREMSVFEGMRALRGVPGSKVSLTIIRGNANDPHEIELTREAISAPDVTSRMLGSGIGYVRIAAVGAKTTDQAKNEIATLTKNGASSLVVDVRRTSGGSLDGGLAMARLFLAGGTLAKRETKGTEPAPIEARSGDGAVKLPIVTLIDNGTSGAAELFAAALVGNDRTELVGEHTIGRAAEQQLIKLPDGTGLWLTVTRYLMPNGTPLQQKGLEPTVAVEEPDVDFGQTPPEGDAILDKAVERLALKKAA